jgi:hypothetical protein
VVDRGGTTQRLARALAGAALVLAVSGCTGATPSASSTPTQAPAAIFPVTCGAATDVASEPNWRQYDDYRSWTTADGCLVRIDVLADRPGPAHCGFQAARVIITGLPIGARYTNESTSATYVRDPANVFLDPATASAFDPHAKLPQGAVDTGFRQQSTQLWVARTDSSSIYLVTGASVERWPLDPEPALCQ